MRAREGRGSGHTAPQRPCARRAGSRPGLAITAQRMQGEGEARPRFGFSLGLKGLAGHASSPIAFKGTQRPTTTVLASETLPGLRGSSPHRSRPSPVAASSCTNCFSLQPALFFFFLSFISPGAGFAADFFLSRDRRGPAFLPPRQPAWARGTLAWPLGRLDSLHFVWGRASVGEAAGPGAACGASRGSDLLVPQCRRRGGPNAGKAVRSGCLGLGTRGGRRSAVSGP